METQLDESMIGLPMRLLGRIQGERLDINGRQHPLGLTVMIALAVQVVHDPLWRAFTRRAGEIPSAKQFRGLFLCQGFAQPFAGLPFEFAGHGGDGIARFQAD